VPQGKTADEFISAMKTRLNLTEEQEIQIRPVIEKEVAERRGIIEESMEQRPQGMQSLKNKMHELQIATERNLEKILTQEQMVEYQKLIDEERQNMRKNRPSRRMPRF
jgi:Spy/CpxP family protein refolding chaperone